MELYLPSCGQQVRVEIKFWRAEKGTEGWAWQMKCTENCRLKSVHMKPKENLIRGFAKLFWSSLYSSWQQVGRIHPVERRSRWMVEFKTREENTSMWRRRALKHKVLSIFLKSWYNSTQMGGWASVKSSDCRVKDTQQKAIRYKQIWASLNNKLRTTEDARARHTAAVFKEGVCVSVWRQWGVW